MNAPIKFTSPEKLKATIQTFRVENKELKNQIEEMQVEISQKSVPVDNELNKDFLSIMSQADKNRIHEVLLGRATKYLSANKTGVRYHPMIIRYCLTLAFKSPSTYDEIRYDEQHQSGFLILPSRRRLRDYKNYIRPQQGFNAKVINELSCVVKNFTNQEKYVVILWMK